MLPNSRMLLIAREAHSQEAKQFKQIKIIIEIKIICFNHHESLASPSCLALFIEEFLS
jgi:hypothetical protein